ncbi:MAG: hypothetical protein ACLR5G_07255 [Eubacteriales bacterium]
MEYAKLGKTDIEVSKLAVGCMSFGKAGTMHDWTLDEDQTSGRGARRLGISFSTPRTATPPERREYLNKALRRIFPGLDRIVRCTIIQKALGRDGARDRGSLKTPRNRLSRPHPPMFDYDMVEETMEALDRLVRREGRALEPRDVRIPVL